MVFPSVPLYLDPPSWNQQQAQAPIAGSSGGSRDQPHQLLPPRPDGRTVPPRPNSMVERARLAKIPQPELALKCPRCDSTNTKFCYFNNYSLSQPRHFCKACRRYWTRGGALRNVPVGGGCRRNKRSSKSSAKSSAAGVTLSTSRAVSDVVVPSVPPPHMPFLHPMMDYGSSPNIGLGFHGMQQMEPVDHFQLPSSTEQWRPVSQIHQFPFLRGIEPQLPPPPETVSGLYSIHNQDAGKSTGSELVSQMASVKMDESRGLNMARQYLGIQRNDQFWGGSIGAGSSAGGKTTGGTGSGGGWMTDPSVFDASYTGNQL